MGTEEDKCEVETYNQGQCYPVESGGSAIGECWACGVRLSIWAADGCPGAPSQIMTEPVGECAKQQGGSWAMNSCDSSGSLVASAVKIRLSTTRAPIAQADFSQLVCQDRKCSTA